MNIIPDSAMKITTAKKTMYVGNHILDDDLLGIWYVSLFGR